MLAALLGRCTLAGACCSRHLPEALLACLHHWGDSLRHLSTPQGPYLPFLAAASAASWRLKSGRYFEKTAAA
eukprot:365196-Chlamydomonas_euryale.AAC.1